MTGGAGVSTPILAIELSQRQGGVAVLADDGRIEAIEVAGGRRDRDDLGPAVAEVLKAAGVRAAGLRTIAVDVGPGGFTGLRVSIAMGQALAESVGAGVVAVPGALVAAHATPALERMHGAVLVLSAAKAGTAWGTRLERADPAMRWNIVGEPGILDAPPSIQLDAVVADEHLDVAFRDLLGDDVPIVEPRFDAASVARLALGGGPDVVVHDDPARLLPIYPREPEAVRVWRARRADNSDGA